MADILPIPDKTQRYRAQYRSETLPGAYNGWRQLTLSTGVAAVTIIAATAMLQEVRLVEWLAIPLTFLFANMVEYFGHKGPMHKAMKRLEKMAHRHAGQHHRFYTNLA